MKKIAGFAALMLVMCGYAWAGTPCDQLTNLKLAHAEVTSATLVAAGAFTPPPNPNPPPSMPVVPGSPAPAPGGGPGAQQARQMAIYKSMPAFCRLQVTSRPTSDSEIRMEIWLPAQGWNSKLMVGGNNGLSTDMRLGDLGQAVIKRYAAASSDTGHQSNDETFAMGHPEKLADWGNRAVHETVVNAKAAIAGLYGNAPRYSYYTGCSTGGRQGWVEAEYYPNDFDGLAIGAPANPMQRLQAGQLYAYQALHKDAASTLSAAKWKLVQTEVKKQCDELDGLKDGLIGNQQACRFEPKSLLCKDADADTCLTAPQVEALNKVVAGARNPHTGEQIYPGWPLGGNFFPGPFTWPDPDTVSVAFFKMLFQDANWDYHTFDYDKDVARADKLASNTVSAMDETRLKTLFAHGGKMLLYHGWFDPGISPLISVQLYESAVKANGGLAKTDNSVRLFMVPNMGHCQGGDGPNSFDKLDAIATWVETGKAPDQIVATHSGPDGKIDRTRPICPYPQIAKYKGSGSIDEAANFVCSKP